MTSAMRRNVVYLPPATDSKPPSGIDETVAAAQKLLRELIGQDFDIDDDGVPRLHRGTASGRIISTVDREMRHGRKSQHQRFDGFKLSAAVTNTSQPLITAIEVAPASEQDGPLSPFRLYGPTCDTLDKMKGPFLLPEDTQEGDWIEVSMLGAYGAAMQTRFNGFEARRFREALMRMFRVDYEREVELPARFHVGDGRDWKTARLLAGADAG